MELLNVLSSRLEKLVERLAGQRVGVYPADFGRFNQNLAGLLHGLDVCSIWHPNTGFFDQGFPVAQDRDAFLDSIDVCLIFGSDEELPGFLLTSQRDKPELEFISVLDESDPLGVVAPSNGHTFVNTFHDDDRRRRILTPLGIKEEHVERGAGARHKHEVEHALCAEAGISGLTNRLDGDFSPIECTFIETGGTVVGVCPVCGKVLISDGSFSVRHPFQHYGLFYRFTCHYEFYLLKVAPNALGLYIPSEELFIKVQPETESLIYMCYTDALISKLLTRLKRYCFYYSDQVREYFNTPEKQPRCLYGIYNTNIGHYLRNELPAIQRLVSEGFDTILNNVSITLCDTFKYTDIFEDAPEPQSLMARDADRSDAMVFLRGLERNETSIMFHYGGEFQDELANRIMRYSAQRCRDKVKQEIAKARQCDPLIWVTVKETRTWKSQVQGMAALLKRLKATYPDMGVAFDGFGRDRHFYEEIVALCPGIAHFDAFNLSMTETIHWCEHIDLHISPLGAGCIFPAITNKPGVFHSTKVIFDNYLVYSDKWYPLSVPRENATETRIVTANWENEDQEMHVREYELDQEELYAAVMELLSKAIP